MDISIVSGTYNRLDYLQRMVQSVRNSFANIYGLEYEIVLVDGGSTDTTQEWCKQQPDIKLIEHKELLGAVKAFNDGAYTATGKYVIMANDDIEFVGNSIAIALVYMETHPNCGGGCFWQDRDGRDWHVEGMQAVRRQGRKVERVHVYYAQVGIFPKWLGDHVGWWCDEQEYGHYLKHQDYKMAKDTRLGLHTYGGDNELSARIIDLGFRVEPITPKEPLAKITDKEAKDGLREINNITGGHDPKAVQGHHPDSWKYGQKWIRRNESLGIHGHYPGPILKERPMIMNPMPVLTKERVLYLPLFEYPWTVLKEQKTGLRDAIAKRALVYEYNYMWRYHENGKRKSVLLDDINQICQEFRPTVFLAQLHNGDIINSTDIEQFRRVCGPECRFVNWNGDYWPEQCLSDKGIALARSFALATHVNGDVITEYKKQGISSAYWQIGWEPNGRGHEPEVYHDIVFLASGYSQKRQELGRLLQGLPYSVGIYGHGWPGKMAKGENLYNFIEACKIYRGAKVAIGDAQWPETEGYVSNRLFQILAAGNCVLTHQWFKGYEQLGLIDGENCLIWKDMADLEKILKYWLSGDNTQKIAQIAVNGENLALNRHSFDARVEELWQMLGINQAEVPEVWRW
jgi:glycosyltransferase involved in cell wall biosynthesis